MYKSAMAGLFVLCVILAGTSTKASAQTGTNSGQIKLGASAIANLQGMPFDSSTNVEKMMKLVDESTNESAKPAMPPEEPVKHTVEPGETLVSIADAHKVNWVQIYNKNTNISNPDTITPGEVIVIPEPNETLAERALPQPEPEPQPQPVRQTARQSATPAQPRASRSAPAAGSSAGNTYSRGYCTWYAKSRRPDLPNNLGNADTWVARAAAQGIATGSAPRVGAIGQQGMHVVYVESVNGDGTVTISEMNYRGFGVVSQRTVPAGTFRYIY